MSKPIYDKYTLFTQKACRFCDDAKRLLQARGIDYTEVEVDMLNKGFLTALGLKTVPQVFVLDANGPTYIGGFEELEKDILVVEAFASYAY